MISSLITDRTQADVAYLKAQREKILNSGWSSLTVAEQMEYLAGLKGSYNATDLNRVTHAMEYLVERLRSYGYAVKYDKVKVPHQPQKGKSKLPEDYTELECIESTGTQYVDTDFVANQDTRVVCKVQNNDSAYTAVFGSRSGTSAQTAFATYYSSYGMRILYNGSTILNGTDSDDPLTIDFNSKNGTYDVTGGTQTVLTKSNFSAGYAIYLFAFNTVGSATDIGILKMYSCQIYDNDVLIRDYVPCINSGGTAGLYDLVNGVFYGNAGTGSFAIGSEVAASGYYLTNMVPDGSFEDVSNNWNCWLSEPTDTSQTKDGVRSLKLGGDALAATQGTIPIISGHTYYGREYIKTDGELTAADCRFEVIGGTDNGEHSFVFGWNRGNYPRWTAISSVITVDQTPASSYGLRTFTVGGSVTAWVDSIILIDLTAAFGEGNEPDKEWCDEHIPFFADSYNMPFSEMFDDYTWYVNDIPQVNELNTYLQNVRNLRSVLTLFSGTPNVPDDMEGFTFEEANNIEIILFNIETILNLMMAQFWFYSDEIYSGEVI